MAVHVDVPRGWEATESGLLKPGSDLTRLVAMTGVMEGNIHTINTDHGSLEECRDWLADCISRPQTDWFPVMHPLMRELSLLSWHFLINVYSIGYQFVDTDEMKEQERERREAKTPEGRQAREDAMRAMQMRQRLTRN